MHPMNETGSTRQVEAKEFNPLHDIFLIRAKELLEFTKMARSAIAETTGIPRLIEAMTKANPKHKEGIEPAKRLAEIAQAEVDSGFAILHSINVVLLWGAMESATRDFLVAWLVKYPEARQVEGIAKLRVKVGEYESFNSEDRMRYLVGLLEREYGAALRPGISRFTKLLHLFGIVPELDNEVRKCLMEMSAVRNVIVHRASIVDQRFIDLCAWTNWKVGDKVQIADAQLQNYLDAQLTFLDQVILSAEKVDYFYRDVDETA